ncbi:MAG: ABC transporter ATP-binding protein [Deltaproteobacteria bacterium]
MAEVRLENISKRFGETYAVRDISLVIEDGVFCVILGPSGCGKSTLLNLVAGLEPVSSGKISIGGKDVTGVPPQKRDIAMVFQNYALYPHLTVYENIAFGLRARGEKEVVIKEKVEQAAATLNLIGKLKRFPRELSGGERQRVATGRAIVRNPALFLFDEPLSNLDARLRLELREEFIKLHRRLKNTVIYVTHDQIEAQALGEEVVVLKDGRVQQVGPPQELYVHPANVFVARFIGTPPMNMLTAIVVENGRLLARDTLRIPVPQQIQPKLAALDGKEVFLGFRPSGCRIDAAGGLKGEVEFVETIGEDSFVHVRLLPDVEVTIKLPAGSPPKPQEHMGLIIDTPFIFDHSTETLL